jgi:hypothetical protein
MKKTLRLIPRIVFYTVAAILAAIMITTSAFNIAKFAIYHEYYSIQENLALNPGLSDGFVCQGICSVDGTDKILVSGYMNDKSPSRIYITDTEDNSYFVTLTSSGKEFTGHAGGISMNGDTVYIANGSRLYTFSLTALLDTKAEGTVEIGEGVKVNNSASFCYADENYVYVGEFHDGGKYVTKHPYETSEGMHYAIVSRYAHGDLEHPDRIYSIRARVQGICFTPDGKVVLSTSYGINDSHYYVYDEADARESGETLDGAPVYYLEDCLRDIKGPAMAEGLDYLDGRVITLTESASDKYIFGKLFFANKIVSLEI